MSINIDDIRLTDEAASALRSARRAAVPRQRHCLAGDFWAELTCDELNQWSRFVRARAEYASALHAKAVLDVVKRRDKHDDDFNDDLVNAVDALIDAEDKLFLVAKDWYEDMMNREQDK